MFERMGVVTCVHLPSSENSIKANRRTEWGSPQIRQSTTFSTEILQWSEKEKCGEVNPYNPCISTVIGKRKSNMCAMNWKTWFHKQALIVNDISYLFLWYQTNLLHIVSLFPYIDSYSLSPHIVHTGFNSGRLLRVFESS